MRRIITTLFAATLATSLLLAACAPAATPTAAPKPVEATKAVEPTKAPEPTKVPEATKAPEATQAEPTQAPEAAKPAGVELPAVDVASLKGDIYSAGSSTVYPLSEALAEAFKADGFTGEIKIDSVGTGGGFERFCKTGETDIANASRGIKDAEKENCAKLSPARAPIEFRVGTDAIAIVVSKENTFLTNLTIEELGKIFTGKAAKWSDVNPAWPAEKIQLFTPGTDSGTFDFFVETVIQKPMKIEKLDEAKKLALVEGIQTSEDDNVLVQGVEGSPYAIGYFGFAYFKNNEAKLKAVSVEDTAPTFESAESGKYKLSRPLFIYSDASIMKEKPQVAAFINYYLSNVNEYIDEVGYFPASEEALNGAKQAWLDASK